VSQTAAPSRTTLAPGSRVHATLARLDDWADENAVRAVVRRVAVTVAGPVIVAAGVAMLVLPGPGLVVMGVGFAVLAVEYPWARRVVTAAGQGLSRVRDVVLPRGVTGWRRALGGAAVVAVGVAGFAATTAITAFRGAHTFL
jgi:hypothetical protein